MLLGPTLPKGTPPSEDSTEELETIDSPEVQVDGKHTPPAQRVTAANLFRHPEAHPIVLDLCLLRKYGSDWLGWEPETLELRIPKDFPSGGISDVNFGKLQACKTIHLVDTFWQRWEVFGWCTMALNGIIPDFNVMQAPSVAQCLIAVDIANQIRDDGVWSSEVLAYLASVFKFEGIFMPLPPLEAVHIDVEGFSIDVEEIKKRWPYVRDTKHVPSAETVTEEQLRRLLLVHQALEESRVSLRSQLPLVGHV